MGSWKTALALLFLFAASAYADILLGEYCGNGIVEQGEECDSNDGPCRVYGPTFTCGTDCRCVDTGGISGGVVKIPDVKIVSGVEVFEGEVVILYNRASDGTAGTPSDINNFASIFVDEQEFTGPELSECIASGCLRYSEPGVFILTIDPQLLGLELQELPEGSYRVKAIVQENSVTYEANAPNALIVQRQESAVPETDFLVVMLFALLAIGAMRVKKKNSI